MGQWDDKFARAMRRHANWRMQEYSRDDRVLTRILEDKARQRPAHVVFRFDDQAVTLEELHTHSNQVANGLTTLGVQPSDKVAIMLPNCAEFLYAWFGINKIGAAEVPINIALKGEGLQYQIGQSDSVVLICDVAFCDRIAEVLDRLPQLHHVVWWQRPNTLTPMPRPPRIESLLFSDLLTSSAQTPSIAVHHRDLASILYTSGTTGRSKGVMLSHHYWYDIWAESVRYSRYTDEDVLYSGLPLFHGNAQGITVGSALLADARAVIVERFSATRFWDDCRRWNCTEANYIGGMLPILLKNLHRDDDADNPVRLMVGAAAPPDEWNAFQQRFNTKLLEVYGMTECYCCLASPYDAPRAGSCGKPITGWDVRIVDDDDTECPPGTTGEFVARSNKMWVGTSGYYGDPEATIGLTRNGWTHTGDLGRMDADGYFYFVDRKKQALRRRGENISSFEVESVIASHPDVLEACVVGVRSEVGEDEVKAVVVLRPNCSATPVELVHWCETRIAYFAVPRYIAIRDHLPKTPSERVEKFKLKDEGVTADCWDRESAGIVLKR